MSEIVVEPADNTSIDFRRCWALGEAYYYLKKYYPEIGKREECDDLLKFYKSRLVAIPNICDSLNIKNQEIDEFLKIVKDEISKKTYKELDFDRDLEYIILGQLIGKDPRYHHIFRAGKHCQVLYECEDDIQEKTEIREKFRNDLNSLPNFVSHDKIKLIKQLTDGKEWDSLQKKYEGCKNYKTHKLGISKYDNPYLTELVDRIGGLILGVVEIKDLLTGTDYYILSFICLLILVTPFIVVFYLLFITQIDSINNGFNYVLGNFNGYISTSKNLVDILTFLGLIAGAILATVKAIKPAFQRLIRWFYFLLARTRVRHPCGYLRKKP